VGQRLGYRAIPRPDFLDGILYLEHRLLAVAVDHRGADVGNDVIRLGNGRVGQQGQDVLQAAAGYENEVNIRMRGNQLVKLQAGRLAAPEKGPVKIRGE
jgi:hypothetical protein